MVRYGGFWWRVLAYIIDVILIDVVWGIIGGIAGFPSRMTMWNESSAQSFFASGAYFQMAGGGLFVSWLYFALLESSRWQATVGKLVVGLVVTDLSGDRIGFGRATGRYFAKMLSAFLLCIGFIMVAFTQRKQGLHDLMAGTLVYKTRDPRHVVDNSDVFV